MQPLLEVFLSPEPLRRRLARSLLIKFPALQAGLTIDERIAHALVPRPHYAYGMLHGARLAKRLGYQRTSVVEFGVAGGAGLIAAEAFASSVQHETGVALDIYGFDMGSGLPLPLDYRDMPYHWKPGYYRMDEAALRAKLNLAQLILGPVSGTMPGYLSANRFGRSPIGCIFFDLDFYSSTTDAFKIFDGPSETRLPRVICYMDDIVGESERHSEFTGVLGAIADFNESHESMKISRLHLGPMPDPRLRASRLMMMHDFMHPHYCTFVGDEGADGQLPL